jgi:hypothetical protein
MAIDWTEDEVETIVKDYFQMLQLELNKEKFNKTFHRSLLLPQLDNRSEGSIEFKHQNISAVLAEIGVPFIRGYKPRYNYQQLLADEVSKFITNHQQALEIEFKKFSDEAFTEKLLNSINFEDVLDDEPALSVMNENEPTYRPIKINYL